MKTFFLYVLYVNMYIYTTFAMHLALKYSFLILLGYLCCQGEPLKAASIHRSVVTECLQWHPDKKIIAIGWQSGEITIYSDADHEIFEQSSIHRAAIGFLQWNKAGTKLVSGDKVQ